MDYTYPKLADRQDRRVDSQTGRRAHENDRPKEIADETDRQIDAVLASTPIFLGPGVDAIKANTTAVAVNAEALTT